MSWTILFFAGLLEVIWAIGLKFTDGFTRLIPSILTLVAMAGSFYLLSLSIRTLPLGTAYAVWVGIGAVGAAIGGVVIFHEVLSVLKVVSLLLVVAGIIGLKISSAS